MAKQEKKPEPVVVKVGYWVIGNDPEAPIGMTYRSPTDKWVAFVPVGTFDNAEAADKAVFDHNKKDAENAAEQ